MASVLIGTVGGLYLKHVGDSSEPVHVGFGDNGFGTIRSIVVDQRDARRIYLSTTRTGVWRSDDGGDSWREMNQGLIYQEVWSLEQQTGTGDLFAGTGPACLFKSSDNGESWQEFEGLRSVEGRSEWFLHLPPYFPHIRGIAFCESDSSVVICGVEEGGIVTTSDGGDSWSNFRKGICDDAHSVATMPDDAHTILVATGDGTFISTNGGEGFARCSGVYKSYSTHVLTNSQLPGAGLVVAGRNQPRHWRTDKGADTGFFVSRDSGSSWFEITEGVPAHLHGGAHAACWDPFNVGRAFVGLSDGSIWSLTVNGEAKLWLSGLFAVTALAVMP